MKKLKQTAVTIVVAPDEYDELYGLLCDVIERAWQHWSVESHVEDPFTHTIEYARAAATKVVDDIRTRYRPLEIRTELQ